MTKFKDEADDCEFVAVLPGSRISELNYHAELFVNTIEIIARERPRARFLVPLVNRETRAIFESALWRHGEAIAARVDLMFGHADFALRVADVGLIASGTASLEAAMHGCPHVVTYRISAMTYWMVKRKIKLPYVALPNILAKEAIAPELLQHDATPQRLADSVISLIDDTDRRKHMANRFAQLRASLCVPDEHALSNAVLRML
jgi:lipid-A-disaccharide synthase